MEQPRGENGARCSLIRFCRLSISNRKVQVLSTARVRKPDLQKLQSGTCLFLMEQGDGKGAGQAEPCKPQLLLPVPPALPCGILSWCLSPRGGQTAAVPLGPISQAAGRGQGHARPTLSMHLGHRAFPWAQGRFCCFLHVTWVTWPLATGWAPGRCQRLSTRVLRGVGFPSLP